MSGRTDRTECVAFEALASAYHEAGHLAAMLAVMPAMPILGTAIVSRKTGLAGSISTEPVPIHINLPSDVAGLIDVTSEDVQQLESALVADVVVVCLGPLSESRFRLGALPLEGPWRARWAYDAAKLEIRADCLVATRESDVERLESTEFFDDLSWEYLYLMEYEFTESVSDELVMSETVEERAFAGDEGSLAALRDAIASAEARAGFWTTVGCLAGYLIREGTMRREDVTQLARASLASTDETAV